MSSLLESLKKDLLLALINIGIIRQRMNRDKLYETAKSFLGQDASPDDIASDTYACAESISTILRKALPELRFPMLVSTKTMCNYLQRSPSFKQVSDPQYGDIIISPTGTGIFANGHVGILGKYKSGDGAPWIMSNDSRTGTFEANFTNDSWNRYYKTKGKMDVLFFSVV